MCGQPGEPRRHRLEWRRSAHRFAAAQVGELDPDDPIRLGVLHEASECLVDSPLEEQLRPHPKVAVASSGVGSHVAKVTSAGT